MTQKQNFLHRIYDISDDRKKELEGIDSSLIFPISAERFKKYNLTHEEVSYLRFLFFKKSGVLGMSKEEFLETLNKGRNN